MTTFNNQENNQLLLNAIKEKLVISPCSNIAPFVIPKLNNNLTKKNKIISDGGDVGNSSEQFNEFLWQKLQATQLNEKLTTANKSSDNITLPKLQVNARANIERPVLNMPELQTTTIGASVSFNNLSSAFRSLTCSNDQHHPQISTSATNAIDLTLALPKTSVSNINKSVPTLTLQNANTFEIPFIECDRIPDSSKLSINEYCTLNMTNIKRICYLKQPSAVGRILSIPYKPYETLSATSSRDLMKLRTKHNIKPFEFNTKSPDDLVLRNFRK